MFRMNTPQYVEIGLDVLIAFIAYYFGHWIGFALFVFFVFCVFAVQMIQAQKTTMNTLLSRLPDRCAFCHREIVDEAGSVDAEGIYHNACSDKLEALEDLRKEAGVPSSEAIHKPRVQTGEPYSSHRRER